MESPHENGADHNQRYNRAAKAGYIGLVEHATISMTRVHPDFYR